MQQFKLIPYLRVDLHRAQFLLSNQTNQQQGVRLWLGLLSPRFAPVLLCRLAHSMQLLKLSPVAKLFSLVNFFLFGIEIASRCPIGPGLFFPHTQGTVIGAWSIGNNATIFQGVTLGATGLDMAYSEYSRPVVGNNVTIGAGAKILGNLRLDDFSCVGANAVVLSSVVAGGVAVGVPAKVVKINTFKNE